MAKPLSRDTLPDTTLEELGYETVPAPPPSVRRRLSQPARPFAGEDLELDLEEMARDTVPSPPPADDDTPPRRSKPAAR